MKSSRPSIVISLHNQTSDYQRAEADAAQLAAQKHEFDVSVIYAEDDALKQIDQLLKLVCGPETSRPNAIMLEPVGTTMIRVAREAVKADIGWIVLNREVEYIAELRTAARAPVFAVTTDHRETGRIQGRQLNTLLPKGGSVVYLQGPVGNPVVSSRASGLLETKSPHITIKNLNGHWLEADAFEAVNSWQQASGSRSTCPHVVTAQNDFMAMGARRAFDEFARMHGGEDRPKIKYTGCDGLKEHGQKWTSEGQLTATILCPPQTALAMDVLAREMKQGKPAPPMTLSNPISYPPLEKLRAEVVVVK
jgi:ABC-type sugar transport system substrate-binding protein